MFRKWNVPKPQGYTKDQYFLYCQEQDIIWQEGINKVFLCDPDRGLCEIEGELSNFTEVVE